MPSWKTPTPEQIEHAISLLARPEQRRYFFDKLQNPHWLRPLEERGFFSDPPAPLRDNIKGTIQFPPWPALQYLARMATITEALEDVQRIALNIPDTENIIVHDLLAEIAAKLPATMSAQFVPRATQWLNNSHHGALPAILGTLIKHLATNGQPGPAKELARVTLDITKQPNQDVTAHMEAWYYGQLLREALPILTDAIGMDAFTLTSDFLQIAAPPYPLGGTPTTNDGSTIWHEKIEDDEDIHGIKNHLVSATRNTAAQLAHQNARRVIADLEARPTIVFHRIALDIIRREKDSLPDLVAEHLTNHDLFENSGLRHEYQRLLHDAFAQLSAADQERILDWINNGPPTEQYENRVRASGRTPTPADTDLYKRYWQRRQLTPIAEQLPPPWAQRYQAIINELGPEPDEPTTGYMGPTSPVTKEELAAMTPDDLIAYMRSWTPKDELLGPSRAGVGMHLTSIIAANPTMLDPVINEVRALHPTYVRNYFYGVREANEKKKTITWELVLDLADWIMTQPRDAATQDTRDPFDDDRGWAGTRGAIADLLNHALNNNMPAAYRDTVWRIITILTEDPDPTAEYEAKYGRTMDAYTVAINTIRGKAIEAIIKYALMVRQEHPEPKDFTLMPEVPRVLDDHLMHDPSLAVRAVYGRFFPWIVLLDKQWASANVDFIFGDETGKHAWEAYVTCCPAFDEPVSLLNQYYERAVDNLQHDRIPESKGGRPDQDEHLGAHLMARYARGQLPLDTGLVARFFEHAPAHARAHAIESVGRILYGTKEPVLLLIRERLVSLWTTRRQAATADLLAHRDELAAFGWWFAAAKLDHTWELTELRDVLRNNHAVALDYQVIEQLSKLAPTHAVLVVQCLRAFVTTERQYWAILGAEEQVRTILATALQDDAAHDAAAALVHDLGAIGYTKFRDLLQAT
jgi:hypothetical protein